MQYPLCQYDYRYNMTSFLLEVKSKQLISPVFSRGNKKRSPVLRERRIKTKMTSLFETLAETFGAVAVGTAFQGVGAEGFFQLDPVSPDLPQSDRIVHDVVDHIQ